LRVVRRAISLFAERRVRSRGAPLGLRSRPTVEPCKQEVIHCLLTSERRGFLQVVNLQ
jgi:hypothetical protein